MSELFDKEVNAQKQSLKIYFWGSTDFLHCWVANSVWLERAECLITKRYVAFMAAYLECLQILERCYV